MGMQLTKIIDPRDNLARATRDELWDFAKANGVVFDQATASKFVMEQTLRGRGLVNIKVAVRQQGRPTGQYLEPGGSITTEAPKVVTVSVEEDMMRQYEAQASITATENRAMLDNARHTWNHMRAEAKRRGIKLDRRDNMDTLKEKLRVSHPA